MKFAKTIAMTVITSSALIMTGCNTGPYGMSNTAKGATAGAAIGGAGGYIYDRSN